MIRRPVTFTATVSTCVAPIYSLTRVRGPKRSFPQSSELSESSITYTSMVPVYQKDQERASTFSLVQPVLPVSRRGRLPKQPF